MRTKYAVRKDIRAAKVTLDAATRGTSEWKEAFARYSGLQRELGVIELRELGIEPVK